MYKAKAMSSKQKVFIIWFLIFVISLILVGCDQLRNCGSDINIRTGYFGFKCSGKF